MNIYTWEFIAICPNDGENITYTMTIETPSARMIPVEEIISATESINTGYQEKIADTLHAKFGGKLTLSAPHRGVWIKSIRGGR